MTDIPGLAYRVIRDVSVPDDAVELTSRETLEADHEKFMAFQLAYQNEARPAGHPVVQDQGPGLIVVNPPAEPLDEKGLDLLYDQPFTRMWHPKYDKLGGVPAMKPVQFSITNASRLFRRMQFLRESISIRVNRLPPAARRRYWLKRMRWVKHKQFSGTISDIGGPTANMYGMTCNSAATCKRMSCLFPSVCAKLPASHDRMLGLMHKILDWRAKQRRKVHVFIASGIRHDLALKSRAYVNLLAAEFVGGHLKVAPEHTCPHVLDMMQKPHNETFERFEAMFAEATKKAGKEQYLVPYFISAHPGSSPEEAARLTEYLVSRNWRPRQVQDFVPAPLALATAMYVSGLSTKGKQIHIPRGRGEKRLQGALLQYYDRRNFKLIEGYLSPRNKHKLLAQIPSAAGGFAGEIQTTTGSGGRFQTAPLAHRPRDGGVDRFAVVDGSQPCFDGRLCGAGDCCQASLSAG